MEAQHSVLAGMVLCQSCCCDVEATRVNNEGGGVQEYECGAGEAVGIQVDPR